MWRAGSNRADLSTAVHVTVTYGVLVVSNAPRSGPVGNIVYEYQYALILGSLDEIRQFVYAHKTDPRPDYRFQVDRQHWWCWGGDLTRA